MLIYIYIFYIYIPEYICYYLRTLYGNVNFACTPLDTKRNSSPEKRFFVPVSEARINKFEIYQQYAYFKMRDHV